MTQETLLEQIRRLNQQEFVKHEIKRQEALNKIREMRRQIKEKENGNVVLK